ncbi:MAG TPA: hypothetical protein VI758_12825 [Bacteroidota bacterium]
MKTPNASKICLFAILVFAFNGCLIYETIEYHIRLNTDGKSGTISVEYTNIESSASEPAKQDDDFNDLISKWKDDKYLLERMDDGVYIKDRHLALRHGILVWRETGIFSDIKKMKDGVKYEDTTRLNLGKDETVLSTNGETLVTKDSTVVIWPPHTLDFQIKIQQREFEPTSHFARKFKDLQKK